MDIRQLTYGCEIIATTGNTNVQITSICDDSRKVVPGSAFVAVKGFASDGHTYIATAIGKGACAIVCEDMVMARSQAAQAGAEGITLVQVGSSRHALAIIAANFYDNPSEKLTVIGITGTKGKTTTTYMVRSILEKSGFKTGLIGTIETIIGKKVIKGTYALESAFKGD